MRKLLFNLHLYSALILGLFVLIIGVTGSLIAFEGDIDRLTNLDLFEVKPQGQPLTAARMLAAARKAYPDQRIGTIRFPTDEKSAATFGVKGGLQVFLNPYTGAIIGSRGATSWLTSAHQLHIRLLMGKAGETVVSSVTVVLLFLVASGIYLWWPLKRATVKWGASARRIHFDLHNSVGIYSAASLFVLGVTGLVVHFDNDLEQWLHDRAGTAKIARNTPSVPQAGTQPIGPDEAVQAALAAVPGTQALFVSAPANAKASYLVALHYPEDLTPGGRSWVNVDQYSGKPLSSQDSRTAPWGTRTIIYNRAIHTGDIFGYFSKVIMSLTSLMLISQAITGYYLWWKKLRLREREKDSVAANESLA
jgi:uncharacterized iron-regulated membrane protein